jgi:hypothetical protein
VSNDDKCNLIARWEFSQQIYEQIEAGHCDLPKYHESLDETMRAARRLRAYPLTGFMLSYSPASDKWSATITSDYLSAGGRKGDTIKVGDDPAQAACDALAEWIAAHPNDQG